MIEVELPDGRILEFPDDTPPETMKAAAAKLVGGQTAAPQRSLGERIVDNVVGRDDGVMSFGEKVGTWLNKAGESMTAGLVGDEADAAVMSALPGRTYEGERDRFRANEAQLEQENPGWALGADVAGAMLPVGGAALAARGAWLGGRMAAGAAAGALQGTTYGFMEGEGTEDRQRDALVNGLIGAGVGGAIPGVMSAARSAAGPFVEPVKSAFGIGNASRASRAIGQAVERSGQSSDDLVSAIRQAAAEGQPEFRLADALGHPGQRQLAGLARRPGDGRTEIVDFLTGRQTDQADRLAGFVDEGFGLNGRTAEKATGQMTKARSTAADSAYRAAREGAGPVDVRGALSAIDERLGPMQGGGVTGGPIDAKLAGFRKRLAGEGAELSDFNRVLDVKKDIQDAIGEATRAGRNNEARLLTRVAKELDGALEGSSPGYRSANDEFAKASKVIDAVDEGAEMARPSTRAADSTARFGQMTPDQQAAARVGYGDRQLAKIEQQAGPMTNRARPFTSSKSAAERNAMALNPDLLGRRLGRENTMFETTRQALGGSQTADNLADAAESAGYDASAIVNLLTGNFGTGARQLLQAAGQAMKGQNEETRQIIARALMSSDPGKVLAQASQTTKSDATRRAIVDALASASGQRTGYLISQNP